MFTKPSGNHETLTEKYPKLANNLYATGKKDEEINQWTEDHFIHEAIVPQLADQIAEEDRNRKPQQYVNNKKSLIEEFPELTAMMVRMGQKIKDLAYLPEGNFLGRAGYLLMKEKLYKTNYHSATA